VNKENSVKVFITGELRCAVALIACLGLAAPALAISSVADGLWTEPTTWDANRPPDQAANGGTGEEVFLNSDVTAPGGVDFVSTTTINNGNPVNNNWLFFDLNSPLGSSLTIQDDARVGSKVWTFIGGTSASPAVVNVESGGEFVSAGINNGTSGNSFVVNVEPGGLMTFDSSIHPPFPINGFYRGNVFAGAGASNTFNIEGRLNVFTISNANATPGTNTYNLINGGIIDEAARPGQPVGNASGVAEPAGTIPYSRINVTGSGKVVNAFAGDTIGNVPAELTIDISDQTVFDSDSADWTAYIQSGGEPTLGTDPTAISGPRVANLPFQSGAFSGSGTIEFDIYDFDFNDAGTPGDPSDDVISDIFHDSLVNGSQFAADNTFNGTISIDYAGPAITDEELALLTVDKAGNDRSLLLFLGAPTGADFSTLVGLPVADQVWNDGVRQYQVQFSDTFNFGNPELVFVNIESITPITGGQPGDFDNDNDVDGNDFLVWQRGGSPNPVSSSDLAEWRANFGAQPGAVAAIPEPTTLGFGVSLVIGLMASARRR
jgi:hypothetical protein